MTDIEIRAAGASDVAGLADVLGRAFAQDPVMSWLLPEPDGRDGALVHLFTALAEFVHMPYGGVEIATTGPAIRGAALWDPPDGWQPTPEDGIALQAAYLASIGGDGARLSALTRAMDAAHPAGEHWYLAQLGTDPRHQGSGVGGGLLRSRLDRCDEAGLPAYLESSNPSNVPLYRHFGFEVTGEITAHGGPTLWAMRRPCGHRS